MPMYVIHLKSAFLWVFKIHVVLFHLTLIDGAVSRNLLHSPNKYVLKLIDFSIKKCYYNKWQLLASRY